MKQVINTYYSEAGWETQYQTVLGSFLTQISSPLSREGLVTHLLAKWDMLS